MIPWGHCRSCSGVLDRTLCQAHSIPFVLPWQILLYLTIVPPIYLAECRCHNCQGFLPKSLLLISAMARVVLFHLGIVSRLVNLSRFVNLTSSIRLAAC